MPGMISGSSDDDGSEPPELVQSSGDEDDGRRGNIRLPGQVRWCKLSALQVFHAIVQIAQLVACSGARPDLLVMLGFTSALLVRGAT